MNFNWSIELIQRYGGKVSNGKNTVLIFIFYGNTEKTDFDSNGFKLLWEKEKSINTDELKKYTCRKLYLKDKIVTAIQEAAGYYNWNFILIQLKVFHNTII